MPERGNAGAGMQTRAAQRSLRSPGPLRPGGREHARSEQVGGVGRAHVLGRRGRGTAAAGDVRGRARWLRAEPGGGRCARPRAERRGARGGAESGRRRGRRGPRTASGSWEGAAESERQQTADPIFL